MRLSAQTMERSTKMKIIKYQGFRLRDYQFIHAERSEIHRVKHRSRVKYLKKYSEQVWEILATTVEHGRKFKNYVHV